jgi:hypothetical protein
MGEDILALEEGLLLLPFSFLRLNKALVIEKEK